MEYGRLFQKSVLCKEVGGKPVGSVCVSWPRDGSRILRDRVVHAPPSLPGLPFDGSMLGTGVENALGLAYRTVDGLPAGRQDGPEKGDGSGCGSTTHCVDLSTVEVNEEVRAFYAIPSRSAWPGLWQIYASVGIDVATGVDIDGLFQQGGAAQWRLAGGLARELSSSRNHQLAMRLGGSYGAGRRLNLTGVAPLVQEGASIAGVGDLFDNVIIPFTAIGGGGGVSGVHLLPWEWLALQWSARVDFVQTSASAPLEPLTDSADIENNQLSTATGLALDLAPKWLSAGRAINFQLLGYLAPQYDHWSASEASLVQPREAWSVKWGAGGALFFGTNTPGFDLALAAVHTWLAPPDGVDGEGRIEPAEGADAWFFQVRLGYIGGEARTFSNKTGDLFSL